MPDNYKKVMLHWAERLGVALVPSGQELKMLRLNELKIVDMLPEMLVMIRSVVAKQKIRLWRKPIGLFENGIMISFLNLAELSTAKDQTAWQQVQPHVRVQPLHLGSEVVFPENINIQQVTIIVTAGYLKNFLGKDHHKFDYLFNHNKTFCIEEFMSPEIAVVVKEVANTGLAKTPEQAYYKLKSLELIFYFFKNLLTREDISHQDLTKQEIEAVYRVRDRIASSVDKPFVQDELIILSGMNVMKLRRLFIQVFGKGLYPYYQSLRMQEAARLLKDERFTVSETAYQLGFSNLSYFGRLFERHLGAKPKKWSAVHAKSAG